MILTIKDRLSFAALFPEKGNILQQLLVKGIVEKISLTPEEIKDINLRAEGQRMEWDTTKAKEKRVEFTEPELNMLKEQVKLLDQKGEVNQGNLELCLAVQKAEVEKKLTPAK